MLIIKKKQWKPLVRRTAVKKNLEIEFENIRLDNEKIELTESKRIGRDLVKMKRWRL